MFTHHGVPSAGALLLIHAMWVFGAAVACFGAACLVYGIKQHINAFNRWRRK